MKVLCILGHPRRDSFGGALFAAFVEGARAAGVEVRELVVAELSFDPDVHAVSPEEQFFEPDVRRAQSLIAWADHLVFVYPTWWGAVPARLKGLLDRCLTPGFAFRHRDDGSWDKLLEGRTAQLLTTMDTPAWVHRLVYGSPGFRMLERATLGYCGVRTVRRRIFTPVVGSDAARRERWLERARREGRRLVEGALTPAQRRRDRLLAWLRALRLQFYPMSFVAYLLGALTAGGGSAVLASGRFWIGYAALFLLEVATVFSNERFDRESDARNTNAGPFNGGSRVLVDGSLDGSTLLRAGALALLGYLAIAFWLVGASVSPVSTLSWLAVLGVAAVGYTVPPLALSHRGLGELDVAFTHSIGVMMVGHLLHGGALADPLPWLLSLPIGLAVLPAIILSALPDHDADRAARKRTLAVRLGKAGAIRLAMLCTVLAALAAAALPLTAAAREAMPAAIVPLATAHATLLVVALRRRLREGRLDGRIDALMMLALGYGVWFGVLPLVALW